MTRGEAGTASGGGGAYIVRVSGERDHRDRRKNDDNDEILQQAAQRNRARQATNSVSFPRDREQRRKSLLKVVVALRSGPMTSLPPRQRVFFPWKTLLPSAFGLKSIGSELYASQHPPKQPSNGCRKACGSARKFEWGQCSATRHKR